MAERKEKCTQDRNDRGEMQYYRRKSTFESKIVKKRKKDIYGFEASEGFISDGTDKILPQIED